MTNFDDLIEDAINAEDEYRHSRTCSSETYKQQQAKAEVARTILLKAIDDAINRAVQDRSSSNELSTLSNALNRSNPDNE